MENKMTRAEHDRSIVKELEAFKADELPALLIDLENYFAENRDVKHFMLLSNELRYYTIFNTHLAVSTHKGKAITFLNFLMEDDFLKTVGGLKVLKRVGGEDLEQIEIWIGEFPLVLFDSDSFFVNL